MRRFIIILLFYILLLSCNGLFLSYESHLMQSLYCKLFSIFYLLIFLNSIIFFYQSSFIMNILLWIQLKYYNISYWFTIIADFQWIHFHILQYYNVWFLCIIEFKLLFNYSLYILRSLNRSSSLHKSISFFYLLLFYTCFYCFLLLFNYLYQN